MRYVFKSLLMVFIVFPVVTFFISVFFINIILPFTEIFPVVTVIISVFFINIILPFTEIFQVVIVLFSVLIINIILQFADISGLSTTFLLVSLFTGFYFGRYHARKSDLPDSFAARYWPLLTPIVLILVSTIFINISGYDELSFFEVITGYHAPAFYISRHGELLFPKISEQSFYFYEVIIKLALCFVPFIVSFAVCVPSEKRLVNTKWLWQTRAFAPALFSLLVGIPKIGKGHYFYDSLTKREVELTISDEAVIRWVWPWKETGRLAKLDTPASLLINESYPTIDGSTSFVPIYTAVANEIYQIDDKKALQNYITCSKSTGAYNRLISGNVDMIFVLQPSDEHLEAAKNAGVELQLTPIAKEAFVFFVNNCNTVSDLSIEQIQDIYLKKITNWKQVGGEDINILPFQRPLNSGSQTIMLKEVMKDKELPPPLENMLSDGSMSGIIRDVTFYRDHEESIGYSFRFFSQVMVLYDRFQTGTAIPAEVYYPDVEPVKLLSVNGIAPTPENIRNGSYPFITDIFAVTAGTSNPHIQSLIDWLLSPQGQELIEKTGYIGIKSLFCPI